MPKLPENLEAAIAQAREATKTAINDGCTRLQVELVFPEIELQSQSIAQQFIPTFNENIAQLKVLFPDTGAAALARRDWGKTAFKIQDVGTSRSPLDGKIESEDQVFLFIAPSAVEVLQVEKLCQHIGDRPAILLNPQLEDAAIIGIGYAGRQLRERFLNSLESCYYIRALEGAALFRCYPSPWQVFAETAQDYQLIAELSHKPMGDELDQILGKNTQQTTSEELTKPKKMGLLNGLQRFFKALSS